jgi:hypothetical protein
LADLLTKTTDEVTVQKLTLERFTPADSSQARLLRLLKTIDFIFSPTQQASRSGSKKRQQQDESGVLGLLSRGLSGNRSTSPNGSEVRSINIHM